MCHGQCAVELVISGASNDKLIVADVFSYFMQPPCDMGSKGKAQPQDYSVGDGRSQGRGAPRHLVGPLAVLQVSCRIVACAEIR
jgi:hypothetical protein